jgi:hypothetical protein
VRSKPNSSCTLHIGGAVAAQGQILNSRERSFVASRDAERPGPTVGFDQL